MSSSSPGSPSPSASAAVRPAPDPLHYTILIGAQLAVGAAALMARAGLEAGLGPVALSAWRLTLASLCVIAPLFFAARLRPAQAAVVPALSAAIRARLLVAGVCLGLHFAFWFASLRLIPVAQSTLLVTTAPLWAGLAGRFLLRQRLPPFFWPGLLVAAVGIGLITQTGRSEPGSTFVGGMSALAGDGLAVLGAIAVAAYLLLVQDLQAEYGTGRIVAWTYSFAALSLWPLTLFLPGGAVLPPSLSGWLSVFGMALVPQLIGHTALNWSLRWFPAGVVSAATLLEPVFAGALAWLLLHEPLTALQIVGAAILLLGVGLTLRS